MAKPEWGAKRICHACGAAFYDMLRTPIVCPKCNTTYDPEAVLKSRRSRPLPPEDKLVPIAAVAAVDAEEVVDEVEALPDAEEIEAEDDAEVVDDDDDESDEVLEDASELGEDDEDMAEVIEQIDDEEA
jgi:uncharacterized protein (TIGR02300 family)